MVELVGLRRGGAVGSGKETEDRIWGLLTFTSAGRFVFGWFLAVGLDWARASWAYKEGLGFSRN